jgi:nitrilase
MLIDPWGRTIQDLPAGEGFVIGQLDDSVLSEIRSKLPALQHRKLIG